MNRRMLRPILAGPTTSGAVVLKEQLLAVTAMMKGMFRNDRLAKTSLQCGFLSPDL